MNINPSSSVSESISWVGKWTFVLAAAGSAVGLGNIWGFPYKAGTEGGSAFVLIYLGCILVVGLPIMMAEIMIGRRARKSPVNAMKIAAMDSGQSSKWQAVGWGGLVSGILILSFYSVIAGICIELHRHCSHAKHKQFLLLNNLTRSLLQRLDCYSGIQSLLDLILRFLLLE